MAAMSSNNTKKEKSLLEVLHIVYRGKTIIISSTFLFLILAFLYNNFSTPVFESTALLKKENVGGGATDELYELLRLQTQDLIGTEIQLIKSEDVLGRVIDECKLRVELKEIIDPVGNSFELNNVFIEFPDSGNSFAEQIGFSLPMFKNVELKNKKTERELYIEKKGENLFELRDAEENRLILNFKTIPEERRETSIINLDSLIALDKQPKRKIFKTDFVQFEFSWNDAPVGSKIYFNFNNYYKFLKGLSNAIYVTRGSGSLFRLHVRSSSPLACKVIADNVISRLREARMEQQKQTVRYSFQFVDEQLTKVQKKLIDAESNLSSFKASGQIMTIDAHTTEIMSYLSTLESEKLQADLLLSNYKNKAAAIRKELELSGFIDQSFFEPTGEVGGVSPFSALMSQLSDLEMQRLELLQKRTERHPDVINLNDKIRLVEDKLASYNQNTLTSYGIIINTLEKKLLKISTLMSSYEVKMQKLPEQENRMITLIREKDVYEKIFTLLLDKREEIRVAELSKLQDIVIIDQPQEPIESIRPRKLLNMLIALSFGGFIGIVFVFLIELRNTKLINLDDLEEEFNLPILAIIPKYSNIIRDRIKDATDSKERFVTLMDEQEGFKETFRLLKIKLLYQIEGREKKFMVTSCEENTGKTSIVANLAISIAQENKKVLVIDCDLRKAALSKMFDVPKNAPGLIEFIERDVAPTIYTKVLKNIDIIPAGGTREDSSHLLNSKRMRQLFNVIDTSFYDYIIIDTPPVTRVVDTLVLGRSIKDAILVVRPGHSLKEAVLAGIQEMLQAKIKLRGIVANAAEIKDSHYYKYRYSYGYGYAYGENGKRNIKKKTKTVQAAV